jgi:hypothetical protein
MTLQEMLNDLPTACDVGTKRNAKGYKESWVGYRLHLDVADGGIPITRHLKAGGGPGVTTADRLDRPGAGKSAPSTQPQSRFTTPFPLRTAPAPARQPAWIAHRQIMRATPPGFCKSLTRKSKKIVDEPHRKLESDAANGYRRVRG